MKFVKNLIQKTLNLAGYEIRPLPCKFQNFPLELSKSDEELIRYVVDNTYSMASVQRLVNTLKSCKYVVKNNIPGDFVECGVWRGGNGIVAKKIFEALGSDKKVWMFDTFEGMTKPSDEDVNAKTCIKAEEKYHKTLGKTHSNWCYASIDDVKKNCKASSIKMSEVKFIQGDVCKTLIEPKNLPQKIAVLRLDTDWYESTKMELEVLYPRLEKNGVLIIDDYGHWQGSRKAVDEYFSTQTYQPLFNVIDRAGRSAIKA